VSFDTLLTVLFVVVFIVLPLVSRVLRERNRPPTSRQGPARPPASGDAPAEPAPPVRRGDGGQTDLPAWLAEAQRRVREARERATAEASTRPQQGRTLVSEDPFAPLAPRDRSPTMVPEDPFRGPGRAGKGERKLVPEDPFERGLVGPDDAQRAGPGLGREGAPPRRPQEPRPPRREKRQSPIEEVGVPRAVRGHVRRHAGHDGARLVGVGHVRFDREAIVSGLIWHEILDEPAWKRLRGRVPSRRRLR